MDENEVRWYVIGSVTRDHELKIRDELRRDAHECFVPLKYELKGKQGKRQRVLVHALPGLYARPSSSAATDFLSASPPFLIKRIISPCLSTTCVTS